MAAAVLTSADPAPAEIAFGTSHVVAAVNLFCAESTIWAFYYIVVGHILPKLSIAYVAAAYARMFDCSAFKAQFLAAATSCRTLLPTAGFLGPDIIEAAHTRTPLEISINFNIDVLNKS